MAVSVTDSSSACASQTDLVPRIFRTLAAKAAHRRSASTIDDQLLDRKRLEDLRRVQNERVQREKMTQLGLKVSEKLGVRLEDKMR